MKITREGIRDGVLVTGLGLTAAGSWSLWGPGTAMLVTGTVLLGAVFAGALLGHSRGKPEP